LTLHFKVSLAHPWSVRESGSTKPFSVRRTILGFHRIRHYGLLANSHRADRIELCRKLLTAPSPRSNHDNDNSNEVAPANDPPPPNGDRRQEFMVTRAAAAPG
jgi:hypothetical protein